VSLISPVHSLSTCHPDSAPVLLEEDTMTVTKLLVVQLITKGLKINFCLFVRYEENQSQELVWTYDTPGCGGGEGRGEDMCYERRRAEACVD
jgi:hypothetical protein